MSKAQDQYRKVIQDLNLLNLTRPIAEFKVITRSQLRARDHYINGAFGGIKIVIYTNTGVPKEIIVCFVDDHMYVVGLEVTQPIVRLNDVRALEQYINHPV